MNAFEWSEPGSIEQALAKGSSTAAEAAVHRGEPDAGARCGALQGRRGRLARPDEGTHRRAETDREPPRISGFDQIREENG